MSSDEDDSVVIADRYELLGRVGRGATGSVYSAYDRTLDRHVAIKLLKPGELAVAEREAQVLARVTHRNVVTIHDFGQADGHRYLVLELLDGRDFREWLRQRPSTDEIIEHFVAAGRGLAAAHLAGLVHRDFKPSNVILTDTGRVVVIDFGLARSLDSLGHEQLESRNFAEGTLAYMAPERLAGHENDERSDQFSFCVAMWEALAGANPFAGADPLARYRSIRRGPGSRSLDAPRHVVRSLERGMHFDRTRRFSTMNELLCELERPARSRERRARPILTTLAAAATFLIGWGFLPDNPTIEEAHSSLDPRVDMATFMLESGRKHAADGDSRSALYDLMHATQLIQQTEHGTADYCTFGSTVPELADLIADHGDLNEARMAYAIALNFAQDCEELAKEDVIARREAMRSRDAL